MINVEIDLQDEAAFLAKKTDSSEDEAWNYIIASNDFFDQDNDESSDLYQKLCDYICAQSGMDEVKVRRLIDAETEYCVSKGIF